jgi:hypothetical protein
MTYAAKSTTRSRQRRRTERSAIQYLDDHTQNFAWQRPKAIARIRLARQPIAEAKRIVDQADRRAVRRALQGNDARPSAKVDLTDVQELRVKLIRRDGAIVEPHASLLRRLDARIATGAMTRGEFEDAVSRIWAMPKALPRSAQVAA